MLRTLIALALPALFFTWISQGLPTGRLPRFVRVLFAWFGYIGNLTLALYCLLVSALSVLSIFRFERTDFELAFQVGVAILMAALAISFFRSARKQSRVMSDDQ